MVGLPVRRTPEPSAPGNIPSERESRCGFRPAKHVFALVVIVCLAACGPPSTEQLAESVVRVEALPCGRTGVGTGTVLDRGFVLTNAHIVAGSTDDVTVRTHDDVVWEAAVVGFDPERDLALLAVNGLELGGVELGDAEVGSQGTILARPRGVDLEVLEVSVVRTFNATGDDIYGEGDVSRGALELSVDVVPGVSGAGVYDRQGRVVGVVFAESRRRDAVTYALTGAEIRQFLAETDRSTVVDTLRCREAA